jgi:hypothetical protein
MRQVIYDYIDNLGLRSFILSPHLPWDDNGAPLYHHNKKYIYVDLAQISQEPLFDTLDLGGAVNETTKISVYFVNDAKNLPPDYDSVVAEIKGARLAQGTEGYIQKLCQVNTEFMNDAVLTHLEFSFRKFLN